MVKKLLVALFLLCVFTASSYAATHPTPSLGPILQAPTLAPNKNPITFPVPDQLIVTYNPGTSPQQLTKSIAEKEKALANPIARIKNQILIILGREKPLSSYITTLGTIKAAEKKANIVSSEVISTSFESQTEKVILKKGTDIDHAIKIYKSLPQVKNVDRNYIKVTTSSRIASDESVPNIVQNKYIVQYAPEQSPPEIKRKVQERARSQSSVGGTIRIAAEDAISSIASADTPERKLEQLNQITTEVGQKSETPLSKASTSLPSTLQNTFVVTTNGDASLSETIAAYKSAPGVVSVEEVRHVYATATPNDPGYSQQWALSQIHASEAWDVSKGNNDIIVAVIDSGVDYNHPDLVGRVIKGQDFVNGDNDPMDTCGHGTHVSGIIGAITNNALGIAGENWNVKILAVKAMTQVVINGKEECGSDDIVVLQAFQYATENGAKVINLSLGGQGPCTGVWQQYINYARSKGITVVVAAGNDNINTINASPGNCEGVINVGATGPNDKAASYSNYGSLVSIAAPGGEDALGCTATSCILSTYLQPATQTQPAKEGYAYAAGTSMAAPYVAGAAALYLSTHSGASPDAVKNALLSTADSINAGKSIGPRLNLAKLMGASTSPTTSPSPTSGDTTPTGTLSPSPTPTRVPGTSPTPTIPQPTAIPTLPPGNWEISIPVQLPGIGNGPGDNSNPQNKTRAGDLIFVDSEGKETKSSIGNFEYKNGIFSMEYTDALIAATDFPPKPGIYQVKIMMNNALPKFVPGFYYINEFPTHNKLVFPTIVLTVGDINNDGVLDVLDYNALLNCIKGACNNTTAADLNDDGTVDAKDLNILLRQFANRAGN